jgi:hypothetical protein
MAGATIAVAPTDWPPEDRERVARYVRAASFAAGEQWEGRARRQETRLTINYARALIRKTASYTFPAPARFAVDSGDAATAALAERLLDEVATRLDLDQLDLDLAVEAATLGDAAIKVTWLPERGAPAVTAVHPATLRVETAVDDPRAIRRVEQRYEVGGDDARRLFGAAAAGIRSDERVVAREVWTDARWQVDLAGQPVRDEANPYGWIPYVLLANDPEAHRFWGTSDLDDLVDLCREINRRMSVLARVLELSGAPIAVLENVDGAEGIVVGPGATWELPEGAKAYLLDLLGGGGVGLHIDYLDRLYRALHDLSETPRTAFGDSGRVISGAALEVEIQPLVQRVRRRRRRWERFHRERNARLLDLLERFGGAPLTGVRTTRTIWPPVLPGDAGDLARTEALLVDHGLRSRRTAIANLGAADPETEVARLLAERALFAPEVTR